jgi:hypothetical protein
MTTPRYIPEDCKLSKDRLIHSVQELSTLLIFAFFDSRMFILFSLTESSIARSIIWSPYLSVWYATEWDDKNVMIWDDIA